MCDRIVVISTPEYVRKSRDRVGGVGYECSLITADLVRDVTQDKFIPALREGDAVPPFLQTKLRVDFREPKNYDLELAKLLAAIRRQAPAIRPLKRTTGVASPHTTYIHELPPTQPLLPGRADFRIEWGSSQEFTIGVNNPGDYPIHDVRVRVEFESVQAFQIDFGDLRPDEAKGASVAESGLRNGVDANPVIQHIKAVAEGRLEPNPQNRFLLLMTDEEGNERASAILLRFDRRSSASGLQLVNTPVKAISSLP